ncbi:protein FAM189A2 [Rhinatrema bivittatum]|uniref:protein FAM189A2 n=1 Tax=Rhinatrema bivittatum TaxID=194408 RepID=UPI0011286A34|nr:protein FAM189A2 [Rhinatrema bivittatum]
MAAASPAAPRGTPVADRAAKRKAVLETFPQSLWKPAQAERREDEAGRSWSVWPANHVFARTPAGLLLPPPWRPPPAGSSGAGELLPPPPPPRARWCRGVPPLPPPPASFSRRAPPPALLPARPLLSLGLLQLVLGGCLVALSFGALALTTSSRIKSSCPFWAGSSVILSGIIGLTTWRRPVVLLVNLFILLSVVCVLLNLAGFILGCQGAQFVSSVPSCHLVELTEGKICQCCEESQAAKCSEKENVLKLYPVQSCSAVHLLLKKVLFALCALNALTTTVCLLAAALRYLQLFATRRPCIEESQISVEEAEEQGNVPDPEDFIPPVPPPSYFSTFYSCTPRTNHRMLGTDVIPLPHIYGARIKGVEVFCPLEPPPPYEAVVGQSSHEQEPILQSTASTEAEVDRAEPNDMQVPQDGNAATSSDRDNISPPSPASGSVVGHKTTCKPPRKRSNSDPVICDLPARGAVVSCEAATQTELRPQLAAVTLRKALRTRAARARPRSLVDYKSYIDTKLLVARFLEQSSCSMTPDVQELVENIKSVLKSDEEHMDEAIMSASFLEQVMTPPQQAKARAQTLPFRRYPGLLHLDSCGDLSTFTTAERQRKGRRSQRVEQERPHSLIGVVRETVL